MTTYLASVDRDKPLAAQPDSGHNRWHEAIKPIRTVELGDVVTFETRDSLDGQLSPTSRVADLSCVDVTRVHPLTGPVSIRGVEVGDLLEIEILDIEADPWDRWGFTRLLPGFGLLRDWFPDPFVVHWDLKDNAAYAESAQVPGVRIPARPFPGIVGVAPDRSLRERATAREAALAARGGLAAHPEEHGAVPHNDGLAKSGLRTYPPREIGGNLDLRDLTKGATLMLPVWVPGANVSVGDVHFAQGDGEVCGNGIEIKARVTMRFGVRRGMAAERNIRDAQYYAPHHDEKTRSGPFFSTTGIGVSSDGTNQSEDITLAARNAVLNMISYLETRGFDRLQAYVISSVAVDLRISQAVNIPNPLVSAVLPLDIFS